MVSYMVACMLYLEFKVFYCIGETFRKEFWEIGEIQYFFPSCNEDDTIDDNCSK